jgi:hypothetical protein
VDDSVSNPNILSDEEYLKVLEENPELPHHPEFLTEKSPISRDFYLPIVPEIV